MVKEPKESKESKESKEPKEKRARISAKARSDEVQTPCSGAEPASSSTSTPPSQMNELAEGSRFMGIFQDMAKNAAETQNKTVLRMSEDSFLLVVSHREEGNYSCQAMDMINQCIFMDHVYAAAQYTPPLLPPYDACVLEDYEQAHDVVVPPLMRHYLTKVSRESCCDAFRTVIDLTCPPATSHFVHSTSTGELVPGSDGDTVQVSTLRYTDHKLIIVSGPGAGLMVTTNDDKKGVYEPLWMSVFLPCGQSTRRCPVSA
ncbi:MAG: hypothetical protein WDW38_006567 [Sanguina aurantia]